MWISIIGFYSAYLLAGMTPTEEFFLRSFSQHMHKDDLLYIAVHLEMKGSLPTRKSKGTLSLSVKHKADAIVFSTYWANRRPMPLHFYSDHRVLKAAGLSPSSDVDPGTLEALRATYNVHNHVLPPHAAASLDSSDKLPLRPPAPNITGPVMVSSSLEEDEVASPLLSSVMQQLRKQIPRLRRENLAEVSSVLEDREETYTHTPPVRRNDEPVMGKQSPHEVAAGDTETPSP
ncbi:hypothetical protein LIER_23964 [Lithospermum erythrorhizon]|uniref:Uncharacterized protein n=1 Tax=Lithospermum erythrorhizon TaxID=34254 RepID=A0AAV3QZF4_LITER